MTKLLETTQKVTALFMLNDLIGAEGNHLAELIKKKTTRTTNYLTFFANVGKVGDKVTLSTPGKPGCHWTLLYIDLTTNRWYYCDTKAWNLPVAIVKAVLPIVNSIYKQVDLAQKSFGGVESGHIPKKGGKRT